jgi:hypothetical protein
MARKYTAILSKENYPAFRKHVPALPPTHEEWQSESDRANGQAIGSRIHAIGVEIYPEDFLEWSRTPAGERTEHGLHRFAEVQYRKSHPELGR